MPSSTEAWLHPEADAELHSASAFYRDRASREIARAFIEQVVRAIELVIWNQQLGTVIGHGFRAYPIRRFPYSIIYREADTGPRVYAVAHQMRGPGYWTQRR